MIRLSGKVILSKVDEECILLDPESGKYFGLDGVGSRMLELALGGEGMEAVVDTMSREYDAGRERIRADLAALLRELGERGLVVVDEEL